MVDPVEQVAEQKVLGGDAVVALALTHPVPIGGLAREEVGLRARDGGIGVGHGR
jgi:hypothetical protein